jgi:hypothetical protein
MNWQEYEEEVFEELRCRYPGAPITRNATVAGRFSQAPREIDILIEAQVLDAPIRVIVDAKKHAAPIDVHDVESFVSMVADVGAHRGILISSSGYTTAATARAHREVNQEWMYLNFWHKDAAASDLDGLLRLQADTLKDGVLTYLPGVERTDARTAIRLAEVPGYLTPEYTGFVEFDDFVFFAVLFTTPEMSKRNLRKLREILRTVMPVNVRHV